MERLLVEVDRVPEEAMADPVNWEKIDNHIRSALDSVKGDIGDLKSGTGTLLERVDNHIKYFATALAAVAVLGFSWLGWLSVSVIDLKDGRKKEMASVVSELAPMRLLQASLAPYEPKNQIEVQRALSESIEAKNPIPPTFVEQAGQGFLRAEGNAKAWGVALDLCDYRSSLNQGSMPRGELRTPRFKILIQWPEFPGAAPHTEADLPFIKAMGTTTADKAAKFEPFYPTGPSTNWEEDAAEYLVMDFHGKVVFLDDMRLKNVIVKNAAVIYVGGRIALQNVSFVDCQFRGLPSNPRSRGLVAEVLHSFAVSYAPA